MRFLRPALDTSLDSRSLPRFLEAERLRLDPVATRKPALVLSSLAATSSASPSVVSGYPARISRGEAGLLADKNEGRLRKLRRSPRREP